MEPDTPRTIEGGTAFVLGGGASLGAAQVGMLRALLEAGIAPDLIVGCSVGALNGAAMAYDPTLAMVDRLAELWLDAGGRGLLPSLWPTVVQMARRGEAAHGNAGLRQVIEDVLPAGTTFDDLAIPFQCLATDPAEAREVWFASGSPVEPILASAAIPGVLPPVEVDGIRCIDGAVVNDVPVTRAVELGASRLYVLHDGFDRGRAAPRRPVERARDAYVIARRARVVRDLAALPAEVDVVLLPTGAILGGRFNDFGRSAALMASAHEASAAVLSAAPAPPSGHSERL